MEILSLNRFNHTNYKKNDMNNFTQKNNFKIRTNQYKIFLIKNLLFLNRFSYTNNNKWHKSGLN